MNNNTVPCSYLKLILMCTLLLIVGACSQQAPEPSKIEQELSKCNVGCYCRIGDKGFLTMKEYGEKK